MKKKTFAALLLALLLLLSACAPDPKSEFEGHYGMDQWTQGGKKQDLIHVTGIRVEKRDPHTALTLEFSRETNDGVQPTAAPEYVADALETPARLVIALSGIVTWDAQMPALGAESDLLRGVFRVNRNKDARAYLYAQLSADFAFTVEEGENSLTFLLRPLSEQTDEEGWYVAADAVNDFESGNLDGKLGLTPVICRDSSRLLLSKPYASEDEARAAAGNVTATLAGVSGKQADVQKLRRNALPDFMDGTSVEALQSARVFEGSGSLTYWHHGMRFLDWSPGGSALMARRSAVTEYSDLEELWEYDAQDNARQIVEQPFSALGDAKYSPDGSLIAFTEITDKHQRLYIANVQTGELSYPDDHTYVSGFDWGEDGRLYYMGGEEVVVLLAYDPAADILQYLEDIPGVEGDFAVSEGQVIFTDDLSSVYRLHPDNGQRIRIAEGAEFRLHPDKQHIALIAYDTEMELDSMSVLSVMDFATRGLKTVSTGRILGDVCWDPDGATLYYALFKDEIADDLVYDIYAWSLATGESRLLGSSVFLDFASGKQAGEILANVNVALGEDEVATVYRFRPEQAENP